MNTKRIGLVGAGNMAFALIRGLLTSQSVERDQVRASDPRRERLTQLESEWGLVTHSENRELVEWANVVVIAVKPQVLDAVLEPLAEAFQRDTLLVSIAAGVPIRALEARLPDRVRVVRAMPNTAAIALAGATGIARGSRATEDDLLSARSLFDAVGRSVVLDEKLLDAVTGLSGSGPAYVMLMIEALADGGVKAGLSRDTALLLAAQTVFGSAKLLLDTGEHPGRLKDMVTSPAGTTIAGLYALEAGGVRHALMSAVDAATRRSQELGESLAAKLSQR
jgi:pyrroline-5-carboxylate reductase